MFDQKAILSMPNCFDVAGLKMGPAKNQCAGSVKRLVTSLLPGQRRRTLEFKPQANITPESVTSTSPVTGMSANGSCSHHAFPEKPLSTVSAVAEKRKGKYLVTTRVRGRHQTVGPQSLEVPRTKGTHSPIPSTSVKDDAPASVKASFEELQTKYDPGYEKTDRIKKFKTKLEKQTFNNSSLSTMASQPLPSPHSKIIAQIIINTPPPPPAKLSHSAEISVPS